MDTLNVVANAESQKLSALPQFVLEDHKRFRQFLAVYYRWMAEEGADLGFEALKLANDVDLVPSQLLEGKAKTFGPDIPVDQFRFLSKHLREVYQTKGTPESFNILSRAMGGGPTAVVLPKDNLLRPSGNQNTIRKTVLLRGSDGFKVAGREIDGVVFDEVVATGNLYKASIDQGTPSVGQDFEGLTVVGQWAVESVEGKAPAKVGDLIEQDGILFRVRAIHAEGASGLQIVDGGTGHSVGDPITATTEGNGSGLAGTVTEVDGSGTITAVKLTRRGWGYDQEPTVVVEGKGTGAVIKATFSPKHTTPKALSIVVNQAAEEDTKTLDAPKATVILKRVDFITEAATTTTCAPSSSFGIIQDSSYYQEHSYVIQTAQTKKQEESLRSLLHIAGLKMFMNQVIQSTSL